MQPATRSRYDVAEYARKQQVAKERARELKEQRRVGILSEDHTFTPKMKANPPLTRDTSEEYERYVGQSIASDDIPIRPSKSFAVTRKEILRPEDSKNSHDVISSNQQTERETRTDSGDTLDSLARQYPKLRSSVSGIKLEVLRAEDANTSLRSKAGRGVSNDTVNRRLDNVSCSRNSDCQCALCVNDGGDAAIITPLRRAKYFEKDSNTEREILDSMQSVRIEMKDRREMESSLFLLKSKLSRRKARSAPTQQRNYNSDALTERSAPIDKHRTTSVSKTVRSEKPQTADRNRRTDAAREDDKPQTLGRPRVQEKTQSFPSSSSNLQSAFEEDDKEQIEQTMYQCDICQRKFIESVIERHQRICAKNSAPRKVYNMRAKRLEGSGIEQIQSANKQTAAKVGSGRDANSRKKNNSENQIIGKKSTWKSKSSAFREAMSSSRNVGKALKDGTKLPPSMPSAPDPSLIQCEYCSRRFNEKAADRHIPFCREKTQRDKIKKAAQSKTSAQNSIRQKRKK